MTEPSFVVAASFRVCQARDGVVRLDCTDLVPDIVLATLKALGLDPATEQASAAIGRVLAAGVGRLDFACSDLFTLPDELSRAIDDAEKDVPS